MVNVENPDEVFDQVFYLNVNMRKLEAKVRHIFNQVWAKIPRKDKLQITGNIEYIICKPIIDQNAYNDGGITVLSPSQQCLVIFNSVNLLDQEQNDGLKDDTLIYCLAHELAHVYFNHPVKINEFINKHNDLIEVQAQKDKDEDEAYEKAFNWEFFPDPNNLDKLSKYQKWWHSYHL